MDEANIFVAPQNNKLERRSSAETKNLIGSVSAIPRSLSLDSSYHGDSSGGRSPVIISAPKIKEKVIPNYLRASSGSCHDFCKYGRKIGDEPKPWHSLPKRIGKPPIDLFISNKSHVSGERKKVMAVKHIHANNVQSGGLNRSPDNETISEEAPEIIKRETLSSSKKVEIFSKLSETRKHTSGIVRTSSHTSKDDLFMVQPKCVSMKSAHSDALQGKVGRNRRHSVIKDNKTPEAYKPSLKKVMAHSNNLKILPSSVCKTEKLVPSKDQNSSQKASSTKQKNEEMSSKTVHVIKTVRARKLSDSNVKIKRVQSLPVTISPEFLSDPLPSNGCDHMEYEARDVEEDNDKGVAAAAADDDDDEEEAHEEMEGESDAKSSIPLSTNTDSTKQNGKGIALISNRNSKKKKENDITKGNQAMSQRKGITGLSKERDNSLTKMKFQRGRTVELQPVNYSPRKLKFRGGKDQLVNQDDKADVTKQLKKKTIVNKVRVSPKSRKVVLRHRSLDDKKDAQGLFNNVIEETASELVKSRKSKVKALVGAFETVISLQDSKPSSNVNS